MSNQLPHREQTEQELINEFSAFIDSTRPHQHDECGDAEELLSDESTLLWERFYLTGFVSRWETMRKTEELKYDKQWHHNFSKQYHKDHFDGLPLISLTEEIENGNIYSTSVMVVQYIHQEIPQLGGLVVGIEPDGRHSLMIDNRDYLGSKEYIQERIQDIWELHIK